MRTDIDTVFTIRALSALFLGESRYRRWVAAVRECGFKAVALDIIWELVERRKEKFDFSPMFSLVEPIVTAGLSLQLKLNTRLRPAWLGRDEQMLCGGARPRCREIFDKPVHTFADESLTRRICDFYHHAARNFAGYPVISYQPLFSFAFESEYEFYQYADYSPQARKQYSRWLRQRHHTPEALNAHWGARFKKWPDKMPIEFHGNAPQNPSEPDCRPRFVDFMKYREDSMRSFIHALARTLKETDPRAAFCLQVGRIYSPCAARRGTAGVFQWGADADEIIVDPSPADDIGFAVDSARPSGKLCGVELDGPLAYHHNLPGPIGRHYAEHAAIAARHGARRLYMANFSGLREFSYYAQSLADAIEAFRANRRAARPVHALYISKAAVYAFHERQIPCYKPPAEQGPVDIISDDLIVASPDRLAKYKTICAPFAPVVNRAIAPLVKDLCADGILDEYGKPIP
jgi:hypothetical protein